MNPWELAEIQTPQKKYKERKKIGAAKENNLRYPELSEIYDCRADLAPIFLEFQHLEDPFYSLSPSVVRKEFFK